MPLLSFLPGSQAGPSSSQAEDLGSGRARLATPERGKSQLAFARLFASPSLRCTLKKVSPAMGHYQLNCFSNSALPFSPIRSIIDPTIESRKARLRFFGGSTKRERDLVCLQRLLNRARNAVAHCMKTNGVEP